MEDNPTGKNETKKDREGGGKEHRRVCSVGW